MKQQCSNKKVTAKETAIVVPSIMSVPHACHVPVCPHPVRVSKDVVIKQALVSSVYYLLPHVQSAII